MGPSLIILRLQLFFFTHCTYISQRVVVSLIIPRGASISQKGSQGFSINLLPFDFKYITSPVMSILLSIFHDYFRYFTIIFKFQHTVDFCFGFSSMQYSVPSQNRLLPVTVWKPVYNGRLPRRLMSRLSTNDGGSNLLTFHFL